MRARGDTSASSAATTKREHDISLIGLLTALTALGQFGGNVLLPGMPALTHELQVTATQAAWSYGLYLASFGILQLLAGSWSDRWGRYPLALMGTFIFALGACASALSPSLPTLLSSRIVQGMGAAFTVVAARATARDHFEGAALARVLATITIAFAVVPAFAPLLGGVLTHYVGWRSTLWVSALVGVIVFLLTCRGMQDTEIRTTSSERPFVGYLNLLRVHAFRHYTVVGALAIGGMSAFFGLSPRLFLDVLRVSPVEYGFYPPIAVSGFVLGGIIVRKLSGLVHADVLLRIGVATQLFGSAVLLIPAMFGGLSVWQTNSGMVIFVSGLGLLMPVSVAAAMSEQGQRAGQAAALIGFTQMLMGALGAMLGSVIIDLLPVTGMQLTMAAFVVVNACWIYAKSRTPSL
jgi:MFS transporter, DHA1 family, multidrug resistance protein